jgi:muramoyltetrapeptide carboxypeptidase
MSKPIRLQTGDWIGVVAPSDAVEKVDVEKSISILEKWGLKVRLGKHVYAKVGDFAAGTPEERMEDLNAMIYDPEVKCIWAAGGGYAASEILSVISQAAITHLRTQPKFIIGYSDVCLITNALSSFGLPSIMGPNLGGLYEWDDNSQDLLRKLLFGEEWSGISPEANWEGVLPGIARGKILASNLETLILSFGTRFDPIMYGRGDLILCLEELDIEKSTLQRQIDTILNHKKAKRIQGLIIGRLTNITEVSYPQWGMKVTPEGLITERVKRFGIPLAFCQDFGHPDWVYGKFTQIKYYFANKRFFPLPNGVMSQLTISKESSKLEFLESPTEIKNESRMESSETTAVNL